MNLIRKLAIVIVALGSVSAAQADPFEANFTFGSGCSIYGHLPVPQVNGFDYCFTEVVIDPGILGEGVTIDSIEASVFGTNNGDLINFDWEIYLGPTSFGLPEGQFTQTNVDPVSGYTRTAPTIFHSVIGAQYDTNDYTYSVTHDFDTNVSSASPYLGAVRSAFTSPFDTTDGLYAQMFFWTGDNRNTNIAFGEVTLTVHGNIDKPVSVPEPGTLALFGIGLAGIGLARRRKSVPRS